MHLRRIFEAWSDNDKKESHPTLLEHGRLQHHHPDQILLFYDLQGQFCML